MMDEIPLEPAPLTAPSSGHLCGTPTTGNPGDHWHCPECGDGWTAMLADDGWNVTWKSC